MTASLLATGAINTDLVATMNRAPEAGETITAQSFSTFAGGKGANQAVSAARHGATVTMLGGCGDDAYGAARRRDLEAEGIATATIFVDRSAASGVALIFVETSGENRIAYVPGATLEVPVTHCIGVLEATDPQVLLATNELPQECLLALFARARLEHRLVVFNASPDPEQSIPLLHDVGVLIVNEGELRAILGLPEGAVIGPERLRAVQELGPPAVVVTLGARGALAVTSEGEILEVKPPHVTPVDTTGAGDAFCGAFAAAMARGEEMAAALQYGVYAGALATTKPGAQPSMPTREDVEVLFRE